MNVLVNDDDVNEKKEVKVLDIDSISQVKGKILDAIHRNTPYSSRAQPWQVDLGKRDQFMFLAVVICVAYNYGIGRKVIPLYCLHSK